MSFHFAPNLSTMFTEVPFLDRFEKASKAGFGAVEFLFPYEWSAAEIASRLETFELVQVLFNLPPGNAERGEKGLLGVPSRRDAFRSGFESALEIAVVLKCRRLHAMFGLRDRQLVPEAQIDCALENLHWAAPMADEAGVTLLLEPLNSIDVPGYFVSSIATALEILRKANLSNARLQFDVYHTQMSQGNIIATLEDVVDQIGHIQISDVPGRHEPGTGEINYPNVFKSLEKLEYGGFIGLEYKPATDTENSLSWLPLNQRS
jgi:hydroxypyruvate isomerase